MPESSATEIERVVQEAVQETAPVDLEDEPGKSRLKDNQSVEMVSFLRRLIRECDAFYRILERYETRFSLRTGHPKTFWLAMFVCGLLDILSVLALVVAMIFFVFIIAYTLAK